MYPDYNKKNITIKKDGPSDNIKGRAQRKDKIQNNNYKQNINNNEKQFQNTKTKIKVTLFKNGFILNNGEFRDKRIPENRKFMEEVEKGVIPHELMEKGINDLGILLENRKNEEYIVNPISLPNQAYVKGNLNINTTNINQNIYTNNIYPNINFDNNNYLYPNQENNIYEAYPKTNIVNNKKENDIYNNLNINEIQSKNNQKIKQTGVIQGKRQEIIVDKNNMCLTPIGIRGERLNIFPNKEKEIESPSKKLRNSIESKKKDERKFRTFGSWIKEEKEKEEEEKKKKKEQKNKQNEKEEKDEKEEKEEKKFVAFGGEGFLVSNVNVDGLYVKKDLKKTINQRIPVYHFNIRLFNGEIIKCEFNQTHTLKDVYIYVKEISGSNNFVLLEGFPPRPLDQYNKTIKELKLENTTLTQKISENTYYY